MNEKKTEEVGLENKNIDKFQEDENNERQISGFWKRIIAFVVDGLILGIVGFIIVRLLGPYGYELGSWGRVIGFIISLSYYSILNSCLGGGQTIGKRIFKICVVNKDGECISISNALLRSFILIIPQFANGMTIPLRLQNNWFVIGMINLVTFGIGFGLVYFYIFNRNTRQSLHDLISGTYVVTTDSQGIVKKPKVWRMHYWIFAVIVLIIMSASYIGLSQLKDKFDFDEKIDLKNKIYEAKNIQSVEVMEGFTYSNKGQTTYLQVSIVRNGKPTQDEQSFNEIAKIVLDSYDKIYEKDVLQINIIYKVDLKIYREYRNYKVWMPPNKWVDKLKK